MNDSFKYYSLRIFSDVNNNVLNKYNNLESKEIDKNLNNLMKIEDMFNEIDVKLDSTLNKIISLKINHEINKQLNFIN